MPRSSGKREVVLPCSERSKPIADAAYIEPTPSPTWWTSLDYPSTVAEGSLPIADDA
jgi:hypothetical protein